MNNTQELFDKLDKIFKDNNLIINEESTLESYINILFTVTQPVCNYKLDNELYHINCKLKQAKSKNNTNEITKLTKLIEDMSNDYHQLMKVIKDNCIEFIANLKGYWPEKSLLEYEFIIKINNNIYKSIEDDRNYISLYYENWNDEGIMLNSLSFNPYCWDVSEFIKLENKEYSNTEISESKYEELYQLLDRWINSNKDSKHWDYLESMYTHKRENSYNLFCCKVVRGCFTYIEDEFINLEIIECEYCETSCQTNYIVKLFDTYYKIITDVSYDNDSDLIIVQFDELIPVIEPTVKYYTLAL